MSVKIVEPEYPSLQAALDAAAQTQNLVSVYIVQIQGTSMWAATFIQST